MVHSWEGTDLINFTEIPSAFKLEDEPRKKVDEQTKTLIKLTILSSLLDHLTLKIVGQFLTHPLSTVDREPF